MIQWRIYYGDGSTYSSEDGSPFDAPARNVQCIVYADREHGRIINAMRDLYWWTDDGWYGGDRDGMDDYLFDIPGPKKVLRARSISNEQYQECIRAALADPDFPPKSAKAPGERF